MTSGPRLLPAGARAVLVEVGSAEEVRELYARLRAAASTGAIEVEEIVPAARTVLLHGVDPARVGSVISSLRRRTPAAADPAPPRTVEVPTTYDGADLDDVARAWDMTRREVVLTHSGTEFVVAFCGFVPGFAYCTGLPPERWVRRLTTPRTRVPAGSVGLAGEYTGIYPSSSPGGWRLIGRTRLPLWRPEEDPPATLTPGTRVRFTEVHG